MSCSVLGMVVLGSLALGRGAVVHQVPSLVTQVTAHGGAVANHVPRLATVVACLEAQWTDTAHVALAVAPAPSQHGVRPLGSSNISYATPHATHLWHTTSGQFLHKWSLDPHSEQWGPLAYHCRLPLPPCPPAPAPPPAPPAPPAPPPAPLLVVAPFADFGEASLTASLGLPLPAVGEAASPDAGVAAGATGKAGRNRPRAAGHTDTARESE